MNILRWCESPRPPNVLGIMIVMFITGIVLLGCKVTDLNFKVHEIEVLDDINTTNVVDTLSNTIVR